MLKQSLLGLALLLLAGCASSTLDKALAQCAADNGKASYMRSEFYEKFACVP